MALLLLKHSETKISPRQVTVVLNKFQFASVSLSQFVVAFGVVRDFAVLH